ncbi:MAG: PDZ domain-containing protein [Planctomycetota bacterium]
MNVTSKLSALALLVAMSFALAARASHATCPPDAAPVDLDSGAALQRLAQIHNNGQVFGQLLPTQRPLAWRAADGDFVLGGLNDNSKVQRFSLSIQSSTDGDCKVILNGEPVTGDRLKIDGDDVTVLDKEGKTVFQFKQARLSGSDPWLGAYVWRHRDATGGGDSAPRKRVMIGINMKPVSEELAAQCGVEADQAVVVAEVVEGYAAEQAGLKKHDIIVAIDGKSGVTTEDVTAAVSGKKSGDELRLRVLRNGQTRDIVVVAQEREVPDSNEPGLFSTHFDHEALADSFSHWTPDALNRLGQMRFYRHDLGNAFPEIFFGDAKGLNGGGAESEPAEGAAGSAPQKASTASKLDRLEERLDRLEKLLERLLDKKSF